MKLLQYSSLLGLLALVAQAHEHHTDKIPEGMAVSAEPLDSILWAHILLQTFTWGIIFPTGMVLGITRSRWHVPLQTLGTVFAIAGYFLGHKHKGRQFTHNVHSAFAPIINLTLTVQIFLGLYLKLHLTRPRFMAKFRDLLVVIHGVVGKALPLVAWVQMLFGGIAALGFCRDDHLGQCLAHFIMGSAFIAYGIMLTLLLLVGQFFLRRTNRSQEFFDSFVIALWGCVNTFTEHRWGGPWVKNDLQHTSMGIIWWSAGLVGMWLSRTRDGRPKRNVIPGIVILLTGWGMSGHPQELHLSTEVHKVFGYTLMAAGLTRLIEISFVLKDRATLSADGNDPHSFQYVPVFLLYASGFLFMGATEEQMALLATAGVTHVSYILILYSIAFLLFLFVNLLLHLYAVTAPFPGDQTPPQRGTHARMHSSIPNRDLEDGKIDRNGNGDVTAPLTEREARQMRDAQEFELDALIVSDSEDDGMKKEKVLGSKKRTSDDAGEGSSGESSSSGAGAGRRKQGALRL